jgi:hypothetical protein
MSFTSVIVFIGGLLVRDSLGTSLCQGVYTTPGATGVVRLIGERLNKGVELYAPPVRRQQMSTVFAPLASQAGNDR